MGFILYDDYYYDVAIERQQLNPPPNNNEKSPMNDKMIVHFPLVRGNGCCIHSWSNNSIKQLYDAGILFANGGEVGRRPFRAKRSIEPVVFFRSQYSIYIFPVG